MKSSNISDPKMENIIQNFLGIMPLFQKKLMKVPCLPDEINLTHSQFQIMAILRKYGKSPISDVAKRLLISTPNMTKLLNKLIDEGFVERFPDTKDRRIINIDLTEKGREYVSNKYAQVKISFRDKLYTLNDEQLEKLDFSLCTLKEVLEEIRSED